MLTNTEKVAQYVAETKETDPVKIAEATNLNWVFVRDVLAQIKLKAQIAQEEQKLNQMQKTPSSDLTRVYANNPKLAEQVTEIRAYSKAVYGDNPTDDQIKALAKQFGYPWAEYEFGLIVGRKMRPVSEIAKMIRTHHQGEVLKLKHLSPARIAVELGFTLETVKGLLKSPYKPLTPEETEEIQTRHYFYIQQENQKARKEKYQKIYDIVKNDIGRPLAKAELIAFAEQAGITAESMKSELTVLRAAYGIRAETPIKQKISTQQKDLDKLVGFSHLNHVTVLLPLPNKADSLEEMEKQIQMYFQRHQHFLRPFKQLSARAIGRFIFNEQGKYNGLLTITLFSKENWDETLLKKLNLYWFERTGFNTIPSTGHIDFFQYLTIYPDKLTGLGTLEKSYPLAWLIKSPVTMKKLSAQVTDMFDFRLALNRTSPVKRLKDSVLKDIRHRYLAHKMSQFKDKPALEIAYLTGYDTNYVKNVMASLPDACPALSEEDMAIYQDKYRLEIYKDQNRIERAKALDEKLLPFLDSQISTETAKELAKTTHFSIRYVQRRATVLRFMHNISKSSNIKKEAVIEQEAMNKNDENNCLGVNKNIKVITAENVVDHHIAEIKRWKRDATKLKQTSIVDLCDTMLDLIEYMREDSQRLDKLEVSGLIKTTDLRQFIDNRISDERKK